MTENLSTKEMLIRLMDTTETIALEQAAHHATTNQRLIAIGDDLTRLNTEQASQQLQINALKTFKTRAMMVWAAILFGLQWVISNIKF